MLAVFLLKASFLFQGILALINSALDPLLEAVSLDLENHIFKMHSEDFTR